MHKVLRKFCVRVVHSAQLGRWRPWARAAAGLPKRKEWLIRPLFPCASCAGSLLSLSWSLSCEDISPPKSCAFLCAPAFLCSSLSWFSSPCSYFVLCAKSQPHSAQVPQSIALLDDECARLSVCVELIEIGFVRAEIPLVDDPHFMNYLVIAFAFSKHCPSPLVRVYPLIK